MNRREFFQVVVLGAMAAGCGSSSGDGGTGGGSVSASTATGPPVIARLSTESFFAFGPEGDLYEVQPVSARVQRFSPTGQLLWTAGQKGIGPNQLDSPVALGVDSSGRALVLDRALGRIQVFDPSGNLVTTLAAGLLSVPQDLLVTRDRVYVADPLNHRVVILDPAGSLIASVGVDELNYPRGLGLDSLGRLHVVDAAEAQIIVFSPEGRRVAAYGSGLFVHPRGLAIRPLDGLIVVVDSLQTDIEMFSSSLQPLGSIRPDVQPLEVQFGPDGRLYISGTPRVTGV